MCTLVPQVDGQYQQDAPYWISVAGTQGTISYETTTLSLQTEQLHQRPYYSAQNVSLYIYFSSAVNLGSTFVQDWSVGWLLDTDLSSHEWRAFNPSESMTPPFGPGGWEERVGDDLVVNPNLAVFPNEYCVTRAPPGSYSSLGDCRADGFLMDTTS
eukprot:COSAG02_NODE_24723_length_679_cov_1.153448_1_plen_155_part_01